MKIINVEDGKKKAYVQLNDVMMMMQLDSLIPAEVMDKIFSNVFIVTDENRFEFAEFTEEGTVEFFEACEWIPDFRYYKNMSMEEIIANGQEMGDEMNGIAQKWNAMNEKQREKNEKLLTRFKRLQHKMHSCAEILFTKQGHRVMPFPEVPDYEGFKVNNDDCPYMAQQGINPMQVLFFRKDGKAMDNKKEELPMGLIQSAESILITDNIEHNEFFDKVESSRKMSDDKKYLITTMKVIPKLEEELEKEVATEEVKNTNSVPEKPKSLVKRFKNWLDKKRSC